ncbi:MAG: YqgE/AlgH family protein [Gammaproteobacteria bacterium]|nr:YqgE/AlgH family protein [Gammaproteobacteria bacterium]MDH5630685.1 YqgE/AlgH family protein [Gammaproteobacteria bacterium]
MDKDIADKFPSLKNQFLIAMPSLNDGSFTRSVMLMCEHNEDGAMGIVINQPLNFSTPELLEHLSIPCKRIPNNNPVLAGGPVQVDRGFVIHRANQLWQSSLNLEQNISVTTSSDILHAIAKEELDNDTFIALGYAGWDAGQLEREMLENSWITAPIDPEIIFSTPVEQRWQKAIQSLGIDVSLLSSGAGHA